MSGNPYGLSGISHYGTMQRVGGKAAGFINKKFFHPSSLRNQEKLWIAQTAHETEMRKQDEMEKRREEERQVEELRKQMYLAGQAQHTDMLSGVSSASGSSKNLTKDQKNALEEEKRRRSLLKQERALRDEAAAAPDVGDGAAGDQSDQEEVQLVAPRDLDRVLAKSVYREDVFVHGHTTVWGSWYAVDDQRWGFGCCKNLERRKRCPLAPPEDEEEAKEKKAERGARGKRRRRGGGGAAADVDTRTVANDTASSVGRSVSGGAGPVESELAELSAIDAANPPGAVDSALIGRAETADDMQTKKAEIAA